MPSLQIVLHICVYVYIHIYEALFSKDTISKLGIGIAKLNFWVGAYRILEKSSSLYIYVLPLYIYTGIYVYI